MSFTLYPTGDPLVASQKQLLYPRFKDNVQLRSALQNSPALQVGAKGVGVAELQRAFVDLGYPMPGSKRQTGDMDGAFGGKWTRPSGGFSGTTTPSPRSGCGPGWPTTASSARTRWPPWTSSCNS